VLQANSSVNTATISVTGTGFVNLLQANSSVNTAIITATNSITGRNIQANTGLSSTTLSVAGGTFANTIVANTSINVPTIIVTSKLDANSAPISFFNNIQTTGQVSVGGNFVINGDTVYNSNTFTLNANSATGQISSFNVNRGSSGANAAIRWNEPQKYFDIVDVDNPTSYSKILTANLISSSLTSTSTDTFASSAAANTLNNNINTNLALVQGIDSTQNTRLNAIETINVNQNTSISIIQGVDTTQNTRLGSIETVDVAQNTSISIIQGVDATQNTRLNIANTRLDSIETVNVDQNTTISIIQGVDVTQNTRLNSIETINADQNTSISIIQGVISIIQGVDATQNSSISIIQGVDATQNSSISIIQGVDATQNSSISIIQGVDATQNTRLNSIETINTNQNTSISIIQGVDLTQNTNITAVNNYATSAYDHANNAFNSSNTKVSSITGNTDQIIVGGTSTNPILTLPQNIGITSLFQMGRLSVGISGLSALTTPDGEIRAAGDITAYFSDERLKTKLGNIENSLEKLLTLEGFYYEANETAQELGFFVKKEVGVSAQQVQKILPEVVFPAPRDEKYLTVKYERLVPLLIEAIKELNEKVKQLEKNKS
jgi:hypothetical protein